MLVQFHSKEFTARNIRYERANVVEKQINPSSVHSFFGDFAAKDKYYGAVPTGKDLVHAYKLFHETICDHLLREVKKHSADILMWDVSYKEANYIWQCHGQFICKGLVSAMNKLGKVQVQIQFHIYTDSHDQMITALQAFKRTN